ncbi:hypothetical protein PVE_R2G0010 [Pseudomonas veronii 1YdBTEX2]|jgi:hypothetical protein|uniref:Lipoprotein n=1 Tax=Pseudomonas veronii 1YdBTEX2 TaxID=1295141 RepID=A0A1D3K6W6_PSEVE|nr:hypothetical protein [Pseudomonas veronii]SBW84040.1 hypothetical protein PVE_R2G0010 [Pseudomonas veronii 1YdBTEX2]
MHAVVRCASLLAVAVVAGCAGGKSVEKESAVVTVSAYGPDLFGQHSRGAGGSWDVRETTRGATPLSFPAMEVRACNQSRTACSLGFGVVDGSAEIISSSPTAATVAIDLNYQVGRSYSHILNGQEFRQEVPADIQALQGSQQISKRIEVAYGEVAHIQLPYGVDVAVCAQKQNASEIVLDRSVCQAF